MRKRRPGLYLNISQDIDQHPTMNGLSDTAFRMFIDLICHCSRFMTDGHVNSATTSKMYQPKILRELLDAGVVEKAKEGTGYYLPAYLDWHNSKAEIQELASKRRDAGKQGGSKRPTSASENPSICAVDSSPQPLALSQTSGVDLSSNQGGATATPLTGISNVNGGVA